MRNPTTQARATIPVPSNRGSFCTRPLPSHSGAKPQISVQVRDAAARRPIHFALFLPEKLKTLQADTGYKGNSRMLVDEYTAFDFGMQKVHISLGENGVRQDSDLTPVEKGNMLDNL